MEKTLGENAKKFLFDTNDFSEEALRLKKEAARRPTFSQEEMAASHQTGFDEGKIAGINETLASQEAHIRDVLQQLVMATSRLEEGETARLATFIDQATLLSTQVMGKVLPALLEALSQEHIEGFIREVLSTHVQPRTLTLHVAPDNRDPIETRLQQFLESTHRKLSCEVLADAGLNGLQCRFEWTGGGAEWNPGQVAQAVLDAMTGQLPDNMKADATIPERLDGTGQTPHNDSTGDAP